MALIDVISVAQISSVFTSCVMDDVTRNKIRERHEKFHPTTDRPKYECALERMAKDYVTVHGYLLPSTYGAIHVSAGGASIDNKLDKAFKFAEWSNVKQAGKRGLTPNMYGCYLDERNSHLTCVYDTMLVLSTLQV
ncbi:hypothetical protein Y032_1361g3846 [Ancylostoma ceylanicum]|uniref:SCP domain-containing protein n=2 Tax=Ancylostoma ceylanicum TaxID=53326 RepID=A0A016W5G3_9BILA|nr:hypothetical protein Y032_1361g3846 [Ancylostoma ceylanicum]